MFTDINTERLYLKCIGYDDVDFIFKQFSTDEVNRYLFDEEPYQSREEAKQLIDFYVEPEPRNQHRWILVRTENNEKIGTCGFHCWNRENKSVEIGYDLQPSFWRTGYISEAVKAILQFAKTVMKVEQVYAYVYPENIASVKTVEKMGFSRTGEQVCNVFRGEKYIHDIYCLDL